MVLLRSLVSPQFFLKVDFCIVNKTEMERIALPKTFIDSWKLRYVHGDFKRIAAQCGMSTTTIGNAFKGAGTKEVAKKIDKYYNI